LRTSWWADDQKTPVDVGDASTHGECLPLKIEIGPLQGEAFVDSQAAEGEQPNQPTIIFVVHCLGELFNLGRREDRAFHLRALRQSDGS
jgi:hypothetical protein